MNNHGLEVLFQQGGGATINLNVSLNVVNQSEGCNETFMHSNYSCHAIPDVAILMLYTSILLCNFIGNGIVISIIFIKPQLRTFTNFLLLNLCFADLSVGVFCMILEIPMEVHPHKWIYGHAFCRFLYPIQTATVYASIFTLTLLSCSRCHAILNPYSVQPRARHAGYCIVLIWFVSLLFVVPYIFGLELNEKSGHCEEVWSNNQRKVFTILTFVVQYSIPIGVISVSYSFIAYDLHFKCRPQSPRHEDEMR